MCKGSCRRKPTEGLFFLQHSNRCAVSEPVSATPASMLRILANPLCKGSSAAGGEGLLLQPFHHSVVPLPLHRGGEFKPVSARPASVLRTLANQTPLGEACKHAPHTCKSNPSRRRLQVCFAHSQIKPVSATPASVLRTLANPLCKGSSAAGAPFLFLI